MPCDLQRVSKGFNNLVKINGALERPNGKTVNWKYLATPVPKSQEKAKNARSQEKCQHGDTETLDRKKKQKKFLKRHPEWYANLHT